MTHATTDVVTHKYGDQVGGVTKDGNQIISLWKIIIFLVMDTVGNVGKLTEVYMIAGSDQISKDLKK